MLINIFGWRKQFLAQEQGNWFWLVAETLMTAQSNVEHAHQINNSNCSLQHLVNGLVLKKLSPKTLVKNVLLQACWGCKRWYILSKVRWLATASNDIGCKWHVYNLGWIFWWLVGKGGRELLEWGTSVAGAWYSIDSSIHIQGKEVTLCDHLKLVLRGTVKLDVNGSK